MLMLRTDKTDKQTNRTKTICPKRSRGIKTLHAPIHSFSENYVKRRIDVLPSGVTVLGWFILGQQRPPSQPKLCTPQSASLMQVFGTPSDIRTDDWFLHRPSMDINTLFLNILNIFFLFSNNCKVFKISIHEISCIKIFKF